MTPSKSMPQTSNQDFKEKYPYIQAGTIEPIRIKDILIKKSWFSSRTPVFYNMSKAHNDIKFGKELQTIMVVETSLYSLKVNLPVILL